MAPPAAPVPRPSAALRGGALLAGVLLAGVLLALCPPLFGLPLAAYVAVGCVLLGGIASVPAMVALLLRGVAPPSRSALALLAVERARRQRHAATIAVAGVVASLALSVAPGRVSAYASEAMASLYGAAPGTLLELPLPDGRTAQFHVRGVWRDYARQGGAIVVDAADYRRLTGDERVNDLALWLAPGTEVGALQAAITTAAGASPVEFAAPGEIRAVSLRIFDRSFAVTYWLQAVAIAIGLVGIAASFSAQVLARRKEFALLTHLGLTRRQIVGVVTAEGALWTAAGTLLGLALGIAVSVVLVEVVNPQSFHWTMDLALPHARLAALCAAVLGAGTATAWLAARALTRQDMALAVKEDW